MATQIENNASGILMSRVKDFCERGSQRRQALGDIGNRQQALSVRRDDDNVKKALSKTHEVKKAPPSKDKKGNDDESNGTDDCNDFQRNYYLVSSLVKDVYSYLMELESKKSLPKWPLKNKNITSTMRYKLMNWLLEVQTSYSLLQETFQLSVGIIDRYLHVDEKLEKNELQLLGVTALGIAAKYEELHALSLTELMNLCDSAYTLKEIVLMEYKVLKAINYDLSRPPCILFLRRFSMAARATRMQHSFAKYFIDVAHIHTRFCHVRTSMIASAATFIALVVTKERVDFSLWTEALISYTSYKIENIMPVVKLMAKAIQLAAPSNQNSAFKKYASSQYGQVSAKTALPVIYELLTMLIELQYVS